MHLFLVRCSWLLFFGKTIREELRAQRRTGQEHRTFEVQRSKALGPDAGFLELNLFHDLLAADDG